MGAPSFFQSLADKLAVGFGGGIRVRIYESGGTIHAAARGTTAGIKADRVVRLILDLKPEGSGTVDVKSESRGQWSIRVSPSLDQDGFAQRLRNVIVNG